MARVGPQRRRKGRKAVIVTNELANENKETSGAVFATRRRIELGTFIKGHPMYE